MFLLAETTVANGMSSIVSQLTTGITSAGLFGTVSEIIPFVIVMIGFAFGYKVLKKAVKGASIIMFIMEKGRYPLLFH